MPTFQQECEQLWAQSRRHRPAIEKSRIVGCFHCEQFFAPHQIVRWVGELEVAPGSALETALCPRCGVDAVLPEWNGVYPMGVALLRRMHWFWFEGGARA